MIGAMLVLVGGLVLSFILDDLMTSNARRKEALRELQAGLRKQNKAQVEALDKAGILKEYVKMKEKK